MLTDAEFEQMIELLRRYGNEELDQWDNWQLRSAFGPVYITIAREPLLDTRHEHYDDVLAAIQAKKDASKS